MMTFLQPEQWQTIRECCTDEQAFEIVAALVRQAANGANAAAQDTDLSSASSLDDLLRRYSAPLIADHEGAAVLYLVEFDESDQPVWVELAAAVNHADRLQTLPVHTRTALDDYPLGRWLLANPHDMMVLPDVASVNLSDSDAALINRVGARALVMVPLTLADGHMAGFALCMWPEPYAMTETQRAWLERLRGQMARLVEDYRLAEQIRRQAARSAFLLDNLPVGVIVTDTELRVIQTNRALLAMLGYTAADMLNRRAADLVSPQQTAIAAAYFQKARAGGQHAFDLDLIDCEARPIPTYVRLTAYKDWAGVPAGWLATVEDVSAQRQAETALRRGEERYRQTVENSPNPIFSIDRRGVILSWNRACEETFQFSRHEMIGRHYTVLLQSPDDRPVLAEHVRKVFQDRQALSDIDIAYKRHDGYGRLMVSRLYPVLSDDEHRVVECVFANSDLTERKLAEERLLHSERMYQALTENLPLMFVALFDHDLRVIIANGQSLANMGYKSATMEGRLLHQLTGWAGLRSIEPFVRAALRGDEQHFEIRHDDYIYDSHVLPVHDDNGIVLSALLVARDVTHERAAEEALMESEGKLRSVIEHSNDGIVVIDTDGLIVEWNPSQARITGIDEDSALGEPVWDIQGRLVLPSPNADWSPEKLRAMMLQALQDGNADWLNRVVEYDIARPGGERRILQASSFPIAQGPGEGIMIGSISRDITEQKTAERRALSVEIERERLRVLTDFITSASHEFRTPLSVINVKLHLVRRMIENPAQALEHLEGIQAQANSILKLVESLLTMTRMDQAAERALYALSLPDILRGVVISMAQAAEEKEITLSYSPGDDDSVRMVVGDPETLFAAFRNIVDNAVRYTSVGGAVDLRLDVQENNMLAAVITDNGSGIDEQHLPHVFQAFYRADKAHTTPGFGLGLTIARKAIEFHKGQILIESSAGVGTTVTVLLPAAPETASTAPVIPDRLLR